MKRICVVLAAILLTFLMADARTVKKVYDFDDFTGIRATNAFEVVLEHSKDFKVEIEISEEFLPFLLVKNRGGILELNFTRLPFRLKQKNRNKVVQAVISMPELTYIELSGASKLSCNDQFTNTMENSPSTFAAAVPLITSTSRPRKSPSSWPAPPKLS